MINKMLLVFFYLAFTITEAQTQNSFGSKVGVNLTNLYTREINNHNILFGINAGFVAVFPISKHFAIQPEILFSQNGTELKYNNVFAVGKVKFILNYITVPMLLRFRLTESLSFQTGAYIAYLVDVNIKNETNNDLLDSEEYLGTKNIKRIDFGFSGGLEFQIAPVSIGFRYNYGMSNIVKNKNNQVDTYPFRKAKNSITRIYTVLRF